MIQWRQYYRERNECKMQADKFLIIGNDKKMQACRSRLSSLGFDALCCDGKDIEEKLSSCSKIILPLPTLSNGFISGTEMTVDKLNEKLLKNQLVFYGNLGNNPFGDSGRCYYNESFLFKNSRLTAQGVLRIILENTDEDLCVLNAAVLGYGRCGRAICRTLSANDMSLTVVTRKPTETVFYENKNSKVININAFSEKIADYDIIINTIPYNILDKDTMKKLSKRNLYIEIASKPYGFNINEIDKCIFRYILAESLPGRFTPTSAGANIADTVIEIMKEDMNE